MAPPPPPLPEEDTSKTNGVFNRPKLRAPMDKSQSSGPPLRPSSSTKPPINRNVERNLGDSVCTVIVNSLVLLLLPVWPFRLAIRVCGVCSPC